MSESPRRGMARALPLLLALPAVLAPGVGRAGELGYIDGYGIRWDTTARETLGLRIDPADAALLANINGDDGDRAFGPGVMSGRLDVVSELTAARGGLGFDVSAQAWYDPLYQQRTANTSPRTFNPVSVPYTEFPRSVRQLMGGDAELLNAYVKDRFDIGGANASFRLGRQTLLWGESLFFANNGIAAGQAPVDAIKALSAPLAQARELYLPVAQAAARIELRPGLAVEAYDQFEWRRDRLPGVASYFSTSDILDTGGQRLLVPGGQDLYRQGDSVPHGIGQFGVALRLQGDAADYGLYALRYDAKEPEPAFTPEAGTYRLVFPTGIETFGASASTYAGDSNVAGEISLRRHMPLAAAANALASATSSGAVYAEAYWLTDSAAYNRAFAATASPGTPPPGPEYGAGAGGQFARGDTLHAQASLEAQLPPSRIWQSASLQAEAAANDLLEVTSGHRMVRPGRTHLAGSMQVVLTASYYHVLPGLDLSAPIGIGYTPIGRSSVDASQNAGDGDVSVGLTLTYKTVWQTALSFTHFIGGSGTQKLADRDFALASVTRSF